MRPRRTTSARLVAAAVAASLTLAACGSSDTPEGLTDPLATERTMALPSWFPTEFPGPTNGVIVDVISRPQTGDVALGRTVTWRVDGSSYDKVIADVEQVVAGIGWTPSRRFASGDEGGSRRTAIYLENGIVEVIRIYVDENLRGVRVTVELPPRN